MSEYRRIAFLYVFLSSISGFQRSGSIDTCRELSHQSVYFASALFGDGARRGIFVNFLVGADKK